MNAEKAQHKDNAILVYGVTRMFLKSVLLKNVKKYKTERVFMFEGESIINTISGENGSGKSTIFDSVVLCQKAYFANLLEPTAAPVIRTVQDGNFITRRKQVAKEIATLASADTATISITLGFSKEDLAAVDLESKNEAEFVTILLDAKNITGTECD